MATKKIYLFCEAGMSTSIMVNKMMEVVKKHNMPLTIEAFPAIHAEEKVEQEKPVAILLGPQNESNFRANGDSSRHDRDRSIRHDGWRTSVERCLKLDQKSQSKVIKVLE